MLIKLLEIIFYIAIFHHIKTTECRQRFHIKKLDVHTLWNEQIIQGFALPQATCSPNTRIGGTSRSNSLFVS